MSSKKGSNDELPTSVTNYQPQILKIKIGPFRNWIERRLTEILDGMEDEILWGLVFNYLEDAQKRCKREGPAANPSGGLNAAEIKTAISGFLGPKVSTDFIAELFTLLEKAEQSDTGIPPEFQMSQDEAENEAYGIIHRQRREMELSDRVKREIRRTDYHNRSRDRDYDRRDHSSRDYNRDSDHNRNSDYKREADYHNSANYKRETDHHDSANYKGDYNNSRGYSRSPEKMLRDRHRDRYDSDRRYHDNEYDRRHWDDYYNRRYREDYSDRGHRDSYSSQRYRSDKNDRRESREKSPIPSSSPDSPSPCWETTLDTTKVVAPRAPNVKEHVPNELEEALKAKARKALVEKRE